MVYMSSQAISNASRASVMQSQADLAKVQKELSSGKLADIGLSLGTGAGQFVSLAEQQNRLQSITDANALATTRLSATTSAIDAMQATATSFMATLTGTNPTSVGMPALSATAQNDLAALVSTLNSSVSGQYIFAGINTNVQPVTVYSASPPSANKQAVDTAFAAAFGTSQTSPSAGSISGAGMQSFLDTSFASLFGPSSFSSNWSAASNQVVSSQISMSETLDTSVSANSSAFRKLAQAYTMVSEFGGSNFNPSATQAVIASATSLVGSALSDLAGLSVGVGIAQSSISDSNTRMATQISLLSTRVDSMQGVDAYALTTQVSGLQTQLETSFELTSKLQQLSLVNFLK